MSKETFLQALARGTAVDRPTLLFAWHHPINPRNEVPAEAKRHNSTGNLRHELPSAQGIRQIKQLGAYLAHLASTGRVPSTHPLPNGAASRLVIPGRATELVPHSPGTPRCYVAAYTLAMCLETDPRVINNNITVGGGDYGQGFDNRLRGPNLGRMNGLTDCQIRAAFPRQATEHAAWMHENQDPLHRPLQVSHPFPPDYPRGSKIGPWLGSFERGLADALRLHLTPYAGYSATIRTVVLTTTSSRAASTIMDAYRTDNIDSSGHLRRLDARPTLPGQIAGWQLEPGSPPVPITEGFISVPTVPQPYAPQYQLA